MRRESLLHGKHRRASNLAGIDGNRIYPGHLNSAPQTVLKTAFRAYAHVCRRPPKIETRGHGSADVRRHRPGFATLAVTLAAGMTGLTP